MRTRAMVGGTMSSPSAVRSAQPFHWRMPQAEAVLSRRLAKRMVGTGVTVNAILRGLTLSEGVVVMLAGEVA